MKKEKRIKLFGSVKVLCSAAILCALTTIISFICKNFTVGVLRITFENLPIIFAGYVFGPVVGLAVGVCSDLISGLVVYGGGWIPAITLGAGCVGLVAGLMGRFVRAKEYIRLGFSVFTAHIIGNMTVKSLALMSAYGTPIANLLLRIPLYTVIAVIEYLLLLVIVRNKTLKRMISR